MEQAGLYSAINPPIDAPMIRTHLLHSSTASQPQQMGDTFLGINETAHHCRHIQQSDSDRHFPPCDRNKLHFAKLYQGLNNMNDLSFSTNSCPSKITSSGKGPSQGGMKKFTLRFPFAAQRIVQGLRLALK
jgi:hypothetical protein